MALPLPTYLKSHRRSWSLTQTELAELLGGISKSSISQYERLGRTPSAEVMFALELVFGEPSATLFPGLANPIARNVLRKATELQSKFAHRDDARSRRKRELLEKVITRLRQPHEGTS
jgi:transcriptional regulator with XRE-family HTH domain